MGSTIRRQHLAVSFLSYRRKCFYKLENVRVRVMKHTIQTASSSSHLFVVRQTIDEYFDHMKMSDYKFCSRNWWILGFLHRIRVHFPWNRSERSPPFDWVPQMLIQKKNGTSAVRLRNIPVKPIRPLILRYHVWPRWNYLRTRSHFPNCFMKTVSTILSLFGERTANQVSLFCVGPQTGSHG